jgi:acetolactate synthase I/II/III large subunit
LALLHLTLFPIDHLRLLMDRKQHSVIRVRVQGGTMNHSLNRRDVLKAITAAGVLAVLPRMSAEASGEAPGGWITGKMSGAEALVAALQLEGTDVVFGIPGAQDNELWDTMKSKCLSYLLVTHEFSASTMADGYARATGKVGVCCIVPGPGVTNALSGIAEAWLDSIPMAVIVTDVDHGPMAHAFQVHEINNIGLLQQVTKGVYKVDKIEQIPDAVRQAFTLARIGEPGPVAVVVQYPFFIAEANFNSAPLPPPPPPFSEEPFQRALEKICDQKYRVGIIAGLGCMDYSAQLTQLAEVLQAPVATSVSGKGVISECHPLSVGWGPGPHGTKASELIFKHHVDLILAIGVRFSEVSTGFFQTTEKHPFIHVDACLNNIGRNVKVDVGVHAEAGQFLDRLLSHADQIRRPPNPHLVGEISLVKKAEMLVWSEPKSKCGVDPMLLVLGMRRALNPDALLYVDVTQTEHWAAEAFAALQPRTYFNPTDNQAMGWSIPASIGGQKAFPDRQVATITGDGCFLMSMQEMTSAVRECLPVKFFVLDDQAYHYMQTLQKAAYVRTTATVLAHIDYPALAKAYGMEYAEIPSNDDIEAGVRGVFALKGPVLVRVPIDYGKRQCRWINAVRMKYQRDLTRDQTVKFAARMGSRALHIHSQVND